MSRSLLGTRIRERRRSMKISQKELAKTAGISTSYMNLIEHNRRGIAGKTLLSIAASLKVDVNELSEGADRGLMSRLQQAASTEPNVKSELDRIEEYLGRFPGWARLSARLYDHIQLKDQSLMAISDRLGHDPFFGEAMHLMLSNVTAIHATTDILANTPDLPQPQRQRFLKNLATESDRLAQTVTKLLAYFDDQDQTEVSRSDQATFGQTTLDGFWEQNQYHIPEIENQTTDIKSIIGSLSLKTKAERNTANLALETYQNRANKLPLEEFIKHGNRVHFNCIELANIFNVSLEDIFYRLAHLPDKNDIPQFGLIECDAAGGVLFRKQLKTLSLPKNGGACPLWPLYRVMSQPNLPIRAILETPTGDSFIATALATPHGEHQFGMPQMIKSIMVFTPTNEMTAPKKIRPTLPILRVGVTCSVCPRKNCSARRLPSIVGE